ncbi:MAG: hypothetical protein NTU47_04265 [Ignavibacteriales bacterium]|nr:hypothetical protein [Ignavibacteriales bacterium]
MLSGESRKRFEQARQKPARFDDPMELRQALLDFIADFANWDNSRKNEYLGTSRALTQSAHEALGGSLGTRPLIVDPFAGGGSIPLEALRVGADAFASDLNPIPVLLNRVVLEYVPKYGQRLVDEVRKWGEWIYKEAEKELAKFYPKDYDGATPIAYLWARTIKCEGPGCGAEVPLIRSLWLAKKKDRSVALQLVPKPRAKQVDFQIIVKKGNVWADQNSSNTRIKDPKLDGTVKRGSATCPCCGFTTPVTRVRVQLKAKKGGANSARLMVVVTTQEEKAGRTFRLPNSNDFRSIDAAEIKLRTVISHSKSVLSFTPEEPTPQGGGSGAGRAFSQRHYGMDTFADLFASRQLLTLGLLAQEVRKVGDKVRESDRSFGDVVQTTLALAVSRESDHLNSGCSWNPSGQKMQHLYARQAIPIVWDFCEINPFGGSVGDWQSTVDCIVSALEVANFDASPGTASQDSAQSHSLPDGSAHALVTDPPYYDAVPYADLADFFYVWLKRSCPGFWHEQLTPKDDECIVDEVKGKDTAFFVRTMRMAMTEARRILAQNGIGLVVFAHKSTSGWEAQLQAMIDAGWTITGSWPIDTELATRLRARDSAALASSIHLVCRPRETMNGANFANDIGNWRDVLSELPGRIHTWMPRLAEEGVVGADAIFACLGPALEIFSRYARVEKTSGDVVTLGEYLENVWAAVAKEALTMIFTDADVTGFEEDARLTAMWLWTLRGDVSIALDDDEEASENDDESEGIKTSLSGYFLEYDAARKIAQGLGAHLEKLVSLIEVKGENARLLPVAERASYLFGVNALEAGSQKKKTADQGDLFGLLKQAEESKPKLSLGRSVDAQGTVLDNLHKCMILFATGRGDAMKRLLVDDGLGKDQRFWKLGQALSALYPKASDEKRWVDGVMARKKGLGF